MINLRQSSRYAQFMSQRGWIVEKVYFTPNSAKKTGRKKGEGSNYIFSYIKKLPLLPFSVMKIQRFEVLPDFDEIETIARKHRSFSITLEPSNIPGLSPSQLNQVMGRHGYRKGKQPLLPTKTVEVDLRITRGAILDGMKKDARASIRKAKLKCKVGVIGSGDLEHINPFYFFWRKYGKGYIPSRSEFSTLLKTFKKNIFIVTTSKQDQLLAGAVILISEDQAYYYYAVTSPVGRKLFAGYLVVWKAMLEAKRRKCSVFDFEGIYDSRFPQLKRWKGFSQFKKKFGRQEVVHPTPWVRCFFPF